MPDVTYQITVREIADKARDRLDQIFREFAEGLPNRIASAGVVVKPIEQRVVQTPKRKGKVDAARAVREASSAES